MTVLRQAIGETLRAVRLRRRQTLREVSQQARVSLGYLSEVERGHKEPSSELLAAICGALDIEMSELLREVTDTLYREERLARQQAVVGVPPLRGPRPAGSPVGHATAHPSAHPGAHPAGPVGAVGGRPAA